FVCTGRNPVTGMADAENIETRLSSRASAPHEESRNFGRRERVSNQTAIGKSENTMSSVDKTIRPEIETVLSRLRAKFRTYVFLEGTAWVIVALGAVFWITLGL